MGSERYDVTRCDGRTFILDRELWRVGANGEILSLTVPPEAQAQMERDLAAANERLMLQVDSAELGVSLGEQSARSVNDLAQNRDGTDSEWSQAARAALQDHSLQLW